MVFFCLNILPCENCKKGSYFQQNNALRNTSDYHLFDSLRPAMQLFAEIESYDKPRYVPSSASLIVRLRPSSVISTKPVNFGIGIHLPLLLDTHHQEILYYFPWLGCERYVLTLAELRWMLEAAVKYTG